MKYIIDHANIEEIDEVLELGINSVTANPTMYAKYNTNIFSFLEYYKDKSLSFLSAEVMGETFEEMVDEVESIQKIYPAAVIKINFSKEGLKLSNYLHKRGIKTAITLVFSLSQVIASMNAHADYVFFFIGRNDENGSDGLALIETAIKLTQNAQTNIVAASIKNIQQLHALASMNVDYVGIPYSLYIKSLNNPLTNDGLRIFKDDWDSLIIK